ncbi:P-loop containing nucleoside triphosphate hydrolase protein, partial [Gorgonomyces haynaldii]
MRSVFRYDKPIFWYPTHQAKALMQLKKGIHHIDLVVEVRDTRIPFTSINTQFDQIFGNRERLVVYNKADLANPNFQRIIAESCLKYRNEKTLFTTASKGVNIKMILDTAVQKCRLEPHRYPYLSMVVVGPPNVGKSTLINQLRQLGAGKAKVTPVGKYAGVTTAIQTRVKIYDDPPIYLVDTPGIFDPHISTPIQGLKISLVGSTNDRLTESVNVADYLLFRLNQSHHKLTWPSVIGLKEPSDDIYYVLSHICVQNKFFLPFESRIKRMTPKIHFGPTEEHSFDQYDIDRAAQHMIELYREGKFGRMTLDDCSKEGIHKWLTNQQDPQLIE